MERGRGEAKGVWVGGDYIALHSEGYMSFMNDERGCS